jgi:hypothetical protein
MNQNGCLLKEHLSQKAMNIHRHRLPQKTMIRQVNPKTKLRNAVDIIQVIRRVLTIIDNVVQRDIVLYFRGKREVNDRLQHVYFQATSLQKTKGKYLEHDLLIDE